MTIDPMFPEWDELAWRKAQAAKEEAIRRVEDNADRSWLDEAWSAVRVVAERRMEFTTDAVHGLLQAWEVPEPHEPRALGPIMQRAIKRGICVPTGVYRPSVRPACNCRPIMVYRSLIYRSQAA